MTIEITARKTLSGLFKLLRLLRYFILIILTVWLLSPRFWEFWRSSKPNAALILQFIAQLKWPVIVIIVLIYFRRYMQGIIDRIDEATAGKYKVKLRPASQEVNAETISELPDAGSDAESPSEDNTDDLEKVLTTPEVESQFDEIYRAIYGSQLLVMKRLTDHIPEGLTQKDLNDLYDAHVQSSTEPYVSFKHFIQFLEDTTMVNYDLNDGHYKLTNAGVYFLRYLVKQKKYYLNPAN